MQHHRSAVEGLVAELLPIAREYLVANSSSSSIAVPAAMASAAVEDAQAPEQQQQQQGGAPAASTAHAAEQQNWHPARLTAGTCKTSSTEGLFLQDQAAVVEQLVSYSLAIAAAVPSAEMARREFAWRNGWFLSRRATPQHVHWLKRAGCQDVLQQSTLAPSG